jgi:hypothetical protein
MVRNPCLMNDSTAAMQPTKEYSNPSLLKSLVSMGSRVSDLDALSAHARQVARSAAPRSVDRGAALCVLAYRALEGLRNAQADLDKQLLLDVENFVNGADHSSRGIRRWKISLSYVMGLLALQSGQTEAAIRWLERCCLFDPVSVTPLIASKTVGAQFMLGSIWLAAREPSKARAAFLAGLRAATSAIGVDWPNVLGEPERPALYAMPELAQICLLAGKCARALVASEYPHVEHGLVWQRIEDGVQLEREYLDLAHTQMEAWAEELSIQDTNLYT